MNVVQTVGYLHRLPEKVVNHTVQNYSDFELEVTSNFRQSDGSFLNTILPMRIWKGGCLEILDHAKINDIMSVKGRLEFINGEMMIIAEHIEYLHPK